MSAEYEFDVRNNTGRPLVLWEIWLGWYHLGQGHHPTTEPEMVAQVEASTFDLACLKYELFTMLKGIHEREKKGEYIDFQSRRWFYNWDTNANSWTWKYYHSREEALKSFKS